MATVDNTKRGLLRRLLDGVLVALGVVLFLGLCIIAPTLVVAVLVLGGPAVVLAWSRRSGSGRQSKGKR
jgi:hypothetical protein